jgi:hypothetical protein
MNKLYHIFTTCVIALAVDLVVILIIKASEEDA